MRDQRRDTKQSSFFQAFTAGAHDIYIYVKTTMLKHPTALGVYCCRQHKKCWTILDDLPHRTVRRATRIIYPTTLPTGTRENDDS